MKNHDLAAIADANRLAFRYALLALLCVIITLLECIFLHIGIVWQVIGAVGAHAFLGAAWWASTAPERAERKRMNDALTTDNGSFVDPL